MVRYLITFGCVVRMDLIIFGCVVKVRLCDVDVLGVLCFALCGIVYICCVVISMS